MSQPFMGELRMFGFGFPPRGWALANGQTLAISQNQALFSLLGTTYGGNGTTTFLLPQLQGAIPMHRGNGYTQGQIGGTPAVTLTQAQIPMHNHQIFVNPADAATADPSNGAPAKAQASIYGAPTTATFDPAVITAAGGSQPHDNMPPYLVLSWCIALQGVFPTRN
jgi:microcystin-dependent protein